MRKQEKNQTKLQKRLIEERKRLGLNQQEVAEKIHTTKTSISNYETGYNIPSYDRLCDLADLYGVSVNYLYGKTDYRTQAEEEAAFQAAMKSFDEEEKKEDECFINAFNSFSASVFSNVKLKRISDVSFVLSFPDRDVNMDRRQFNALVDAIAESFSNTIKLLFEFTE